MQQQDHPHIHGEHLFQHVIPLLHPGSPPHTWGTLIGVGADKLFGRITPTYMGNTLTSTSSLRHYQDHPHIHGEHAIIYWIMTGNKGSPPHTWGTHLDIDSAIDYYRITPTYMGNTISSYVLQ